MPRFKVTFEAFGIEIERVVESWTEGSAIDQAIRELSKEMAREAKVFQIDGPESGEPGGPCADCFGSGDEHHYDQDDQGYILTGNKCPRCAGTGIEPTIAAWIERAVNVVLPAATATLPNHAAVVGQIVDVISHLKNLEASGDMSGWDLEEQITAILEFEERYSQVAR